MTPPRYGVAYGAAIFVGKVLGNQGGGGDGAVLEGINWAVENRCDIISMSLGSATEIDQPYSEIFEEVARRALVAGTVIIAAAGNESNRPDHIAPVSHPANCPSILAVAAVDENLDVAAFSSGGLAPDGGQVDIAAPGVNIRSAWPRPELYKTISGTSMATPFVSGIAALYAETQPRARGRDMVKLLLENVRELGFPPRDVGAGLAQAPAGPASQRQPQTPLSILVHPDDMHRFDEIVQRCKDAGLSVRKEMTAIGVISGTIDASHVDQLNAIKGVCRVEAERQIHVLGPQEKPLPPQQE
jgi:subtilisin family serine protease